MQRKLQGITPTDRSIAGSDITEVGVRTQPETHKVLQYAVGALEGAQFYGLSDQDFEMLLVRLCASRALWKRCLNDILIYILAWRGSSSESVMDAVNSMNWAARHVRISEGTQLLKSLLYEHQDQLVRAVVNAHVMDLMQNNRSKSMCQQCCNTKYYRGLRGSFPELDQRIKQLCSSWGLHYIASCPESKKCFPDQKSTFLYINPVWAPDAVADCLSHVDKLESSSCLLITSWKTFTGCPDISDQQRVHASIQELEVHVLKGPRWKGSCFRDPVQGWVEEERSTKIGTKKGGVSIYRPDRYHNPGNNARYAGVRECKKKRAKQAKTS